jgi:hypothetical protein
MDNDAPIAADPPDNRPHRTPNDQRVESWAELHEALFAGSWQPALERFRSDYAFRGLGCAEASLHTSLARLGGPFDELEGDLLRNFRKYAGLQAVPVDSLWNWLSVARHHGLPTRLLDWSFSPYVALHFATAHTALYDQDAAVWCVNFNAAHQQLPARLREALESEGSGVFTVEMLSEAAPSLEELDALAEAPFAVFFEPPALDARLVNQFALFSLLSDPRAHFDDWLQARPVCYRRLIIPAELKWEIRDKLDMANITERVLFPGLDGLSQWLARHYMKR